MLTGAPGIEVVGDADDGDRLVDVVRETTPDVVLLDIRMPRLDGVSALRALRATPDVPQPVVVVLTTFDTEPVVLDALRAGASGFLLKHTPPADIVQAIRAAADGEPTVSPTVLRRLIDHVADPRGGVGADQEGSGGRLTPRMAADRAASPRSRTVSGRWRSPSRRVLAMPRSPAGMYLSHGSVKAHISSALTKLGLENRTQLAIAAHTAGIVGL